MDSFIAPIPKIHFDAGQFLLNEKDWIALGTDAWELMKEFAVGANVLIYVSHDQADPVVTHRAEFLGLIDNPVDMKKAEVEGYRPNTAIGERWVCYWRIGKVEKLVEPIPFGNVQLKSGKYLTSYPRGPMATKS
ncbi:hypothetical protein CLV44_12416 [Marinobacterium halophilum]|uniref:Uncharacterized protein n=1 Tax=Marinobacterium halophilum TaxID=267374 RepID=A0A2P8EN86_9GAMM|nr:hypothetical protein [Marinobacterium halophilum]PSL10936.1 hypothetical protein CLV44_12416 [Marinobacterium halophilum]